MKNTALILGDIFAIAVITVIGFVSHRETGVSILPRAAAVFFPLVVGWFLLAPGMGLFQDRNISDAAQLWRPVLAMIFIGTWAAVLRGLLLNAPIIPIFAVVLSATSAFGMLVWRGIYCFLERR